MEWLFKEPRERTKTQVLIRKSYSLWLLMDHVLPFSDSVLHIWYGGGLSHCWTDFYARKALHLSMYVEARRQHLGALLLSETRPLIGLQLCQQAWLAGHWGPDINLSSCPISLLLGTQFLTFVRQTLQQLRQTLVLDFGDRTWYVFWPQSHYYLCFLG